MDRFEAMRLFTRIVELGSFSRAAEQLGLARASATQVIKQLEQHLGTRLLSRTTRRVTPTVDGETYYRRCVAILGDVDEAEAALAHAGQSPRGSIRVDLSSSLCRLVLLPALPAFCARHPLIRLEISVSDRHIDLEREGVDCALRIGALRDTPYVARRLGTLAQLTCASTDYLERHGRPRTIADLHAHRAVDYLSANSGKPVPMRFVVDGRSEDVSLPGSVSVNNGDAYVAACEAGFGLIQVPHYHVARQLAEGTIEEVLAEFRPPALPLHVVSRPTRQQSARVRVFVDWLGELFAGSPD